LFRVIIYGERGMARRWDGNVAAPGQEPLSHAPLQEKGRLNTISVCGDFVERVFACLLQDPNA
jgi:hypothetical protein